MSFEAEIRAGLRSFRRAVSCAALFSLALNLLMLTVPLYMMSVYDRVLSSRSGETLLMLTIVALAAIAMAGALEAVRQIVLSRAGTRIETTFGAHVLRAALDNRGDTDVQGLRDIAHLRQFVSSPLVCALLDAPVVPLYLALLYLIEPHLGWLSVGMALLIVLAAAVNQRLSSKPLAESSSRAAAALETAQSHARNAEVVRAMGMFANCVAAWGRDNGPALAAADRAALANALLNGVTHWLRLALQIGILGYGAWLVLTDNALSAGIIFAASIISARALAPLNHVIGGWRSLVFAHQARTRLARRIADAGSGEEGMALPAPQGSIAAERLVYRAPQGGEPILKGLSFSIEPGDAIGIIGPSGAGKSTLARLLVGALAPTAGQVRIGGDDLANWRSEALGPHIGYLPQDVELFPASVAQNIARMEARPDPDKVLAAARLANCHELIQRLPQGYDTQLGAQGQALSGGQRQRIALARAYYGMPRIVVLDEPNASLDSDGEQALIQALKEARAAGITSLVITQRTSVVTALTRIMVLREGRIEAFGPRDEVLQTQIRPAPAPETSGFAAATARFG